MSRFATILLVLTVMLVPLAGCGKKAQPNVPEGEKSTYPHPYPAPNNGDGTKPDPTNPKPVTPP